MNRTPVNRGDEKLPSIYLFDQNDYSEIKKDIAIPVFNAKKKVLTNSQPSIIEIRNVYKDILSFISERKLIIYGGTALDCALKSVGQPGYYNEWELGDIDFYSTSLTDIIDLANNLHIKGYVGVTVSEALHVETYALFVNGKLYCEFSYVPKKIVGYIPYLIVDHKFDNWKSKLKVVHPHFAFIDMLRMFTDMSAGFRWEKQYGRLQQMNLYFPLDDYSQKEIPVLEPEDDVKTLMDLIYKDFIVQPGIIEYLILTGILAYNFYMVSATKELNNGRKDEKYADLSLMVPFLDFICQSEDITTKTYQRIGNELLDFVKAKAQDADLVSYEEFNPFFQFTNRMLVIYYDKRPVVRIIDGSNKCIPLFSVKSGKKIGCYQATLLSLLVFRFKARVERSSPDDYNSVLEKIYNWTASNLIKMANIYRHTFHKSPLDDSLFQELVTNCDGLFITPDRLAMAKRNARRLAGKRVKFDYKPAEFEKMNDESKEKFDPSLFLFGNSAGTIMTSNATGKHGKLIGKGNFLREESDEDKEGGFYPMDD